MTIFEGLILLAAIVIMIIITNGITLIVRKLNKIIDRQYDNLETLSNIRGDTVDIFQELSNIENNILDESKGLPALVDIVDKMHRNLCVEIADKMVDRAYPPTNTIKVKGKRCELTDEELMKRINEDDKED